MIRRLLREILAGDNFGKILFSLIFDTVQGGFQFYGSLLSVLLGLFFQFLVYFPPILWVPRLVWFGLPIRNVALDKL